MKFAVRFLLPRMPIFPLIVGISICRTFFCLIIKNLGNFCEKFAFEKFTSDGEANVKTISAADPDVGAGAVEVACVRAVIMH